jgi:hypothetical protein
MVTGLSLAFFEWGGIYILKFDFPRISSNLAKKFLEFPRIWLKNSSNFLEFGVEISVATLCVSVCLSVRVNDYLNNGSTDFQNFGRVGKVI